MGGERGALITGINGQDGSYLAELLLEKGYRVYGIMRRSSTPNTWRIEQLFGRVELIEGDVTDLASLSHIMKRVQPDEIYNLAAQSYVGVSFKEPLHTAEATGMSVIKLLEAMRLFAPNARFYQASTSELFGKNMSEECTQDELTNFHPRSPYAVAKLFAYWAVVNYREGYGLYACNGILFNHESPRRGIEFVTRKISDGVARIKLGLADEIRLGNLSAQRDWGYAGDYVEAMWLMLQQDEPDDYVVATGETHSVREFAEAAFAAAGISDWEKHVKQDPRYMRPADVPRLCGLPAKAKEKLGWEPKVKFRELVKLMVAADIERHSIQPMRKSEIEFEVEGLKERVERLEGAGGAQRRYFELAKMLAKRPAVDH